MILTDSTIYLAGIGSGLGIVYFYNLIYLDILEKKIKLAELKNK